MASTDTAARLAPYVERLLDNSYVQDNLREGIANLRAAYERSQKRRVKAARDERIRHQVRQAAVSLTEAGRVVTTGRKKPKKRRGRRLALVLGLGVVAAGAAVAFSEELRSVILGEDTTAPSTEATPATEPAQPAAEGAVA